MRNNLISVITAVFVTLVALGVLVGMPWAYNWIWRPNALDADRNAVMHSRQYTQTQLTKLYDLQLNWEDLERSKKGNDPVASAQQAAIIRQMKLAVKQIPNPPYDITSFLQNK